MNAIDILEQLRHLGVTVTTDGEKLKFNAPAGVITTAMKAELAKHKKRIIKILTRDEPGSIVRPIPVRFNVEHPPRDCARDACDGIPEARGDLFLCPACGCWMSNAGALSTADQACLDERAGIKEFDGNIPRGRAEEQSALEFAEMSAMVH